MTNPVTHLNITHEQEIVICSVRNDHDQDDRIVQILGERVDWHEINHFALIHGVLPLLYSRLKEIDCSYVPLAEMEQMKKSYVINAQRNLRLTRMMIRIADLFSQQGIGFIPIKGPILAQMLYGDTSLRQFSDLDIFIDEKDFYLCDKILSAVGFSPKLQISKKEQSWLIRTDTEYQYTFQGDLLELHWAIAERGVSYPLSKSEFWQDFQPVEFHGKQLLSFSPESLLLLLCIHGTKHMWEKLAWICDLAYFTRAYPGFNWLKFVGQTANNGFSRVVGLSLQLAEKIGGAKIPESILSTYRSDPIVIELSEMAIANIISYTTNSERSQFGYYLKSRERFRDRLYLVFDQAFVPKQVDWMTLSLPQLLYPFYYIYRPIRLLFKFGSEKTNSARLSNAG